jgi:U2-associated protein SR140
MDPLALCVILQVYCLNYSYAIYTSSQVKIMWPRGEATSGPGADITSSRKAKSAGLSGFVQYMKRRDAETCVREMDGFDWGGSILRVGWSKAVPSVSKALYGETTSILFAYV